MEDSEMLDYPAAMTIELDRWQFERRLHHYVEFQYWEKLQRLRVSSGKPTNDRTRRSSSKYPGVVKSEIESDSESDCENESERDYINCKPHH